MSKFGKKDNHSKIKLILKVFGLLGVLTEAFLFAKNRVNLKQVKRFIKHEKREVKELLTGKEDLKRFSEDTDSLLKDLFIPSKSNGHRPLVLRPKSLAAYALIALIVKLSVTGFLFTTYPSEAELSAIISANMVNLINQSRIEAGVSPIEHNPSLAKFAEIKGQDMIERDYFAHDTPDGKRPWEWINRGEYDYIYAGENLAMDFITAEVVHDAFMKSPSHRRNILNSKYKEAGIAVLEGEIEGHKTILLVEFFGTQRKDLDSLALADQPGQTPVATGTIEPPVIPPTDIAGVETSVPEIEHPERHKTIVTDPSSPTPGPINEGVIVVATTQQASKTIINEVIEYSNIFFIAFLIFIGISLLLNIFIEIRVQHAPVILQSVAMIALLTSMILVKLHFIETVAPQMLIL